MRVIEINRRRYTVRAEKEDNQNFVASAIGLGIFAAIVMLIFPSVVPFRFFEFWKPTGSIGNWLYTAWPVFAWGAGFTALVSFLTHNKREENRNAEDHLFGGLIISVLAGVLEEISFRWLIFLAAMIVVQIVNFILLGFMGFGLVELIFNWIAGPIANFFTLGLLSDVLRNPEIWYVGAGLLSANAAFRDGHKYLGIVGYVNSWFIGMFFFYLVFTYGLLAAILVHFLYDLAIFVVRYVDMVIERAQGRV